MWYPILAMTASLILFLITVAVAFIFLFNKRVSKIEQNRSLLKDLLAKYNLEVPQELERAVVKSIKTM